MVTTLDDKKRLAIGERLADLKAFQELIISNDQKLIDACPYEDDRDRLRSMLEDDRSLPRLIIIVVRNRKNKWQANSKQPRAEFNKKWQHLQVKIL